MTYNSLQYDPLSGGIQIFYLRKLSVVFSILEGVRGVQFFFKSIKIGCIQDDPPFWGVIKKNFMHETDVRVFSPQRGIRGSENSLKN